MPKARALRLSDDFEAFLEQALPAATFPDALYDATQLLRRLRRLEARYQELAEANRRKNDELRRLSRSKRRGRRRAQRRITERMVEDLDGDANR